MNLGSYNLFCLQTKGRLPFNVLPRVPTAQGKQGKWPQKISVRENTGNLEILPNPRENTGNLVCSSCKFHDSKRKRYFDF